MTTLFPSTKSTIVKLWGLSFRLFGKSFKQVWYFGLLFQCFTMLQHVEFFGENIYLNLIPSFVFLTLGAYITCLFFYRMYNVGIGKVVSWNELVKYVNSRYFSYVCALIIWIGFFTFIFMSFALFFPNLMLKVERLLMILVTLCFAPVMFLCAPLILLDKKNPLNGFIDGFVLVWGNWWRSFMPILFVVILVLSLHFIQQVVGLSWPYMRLAKNLVYSLNWLLIFSWILMLFNDLKLRKKKDSVTGIIT